MPIDKAKYHDLESLFRAQVEKDKGHAIERVVKGWGVYLPCEEPGSQVDYIFVGMEPSFGWADSIEHAEQKIAEWISEFRPSRRLQRYADEGKPLPVQALHRAVSLSAGRDLSPDGRVEGGNAGDGGCPGS